MSTPEAPIFELNAPLLPDSLGAARVGATPPVLGLWSAAPAPPPEAVAFQLPATPPPTGPVWRVNLPADSWQAQRRLATGLQHIQVARQALPAIEQRVGHLLAVGTQADQQSEGLAFSLPVATALTAPERDLLADLANLSRHTGHRDPTAISFGQPGAPTPQRGMAGVRDFLRHMLHVVANYAWVETRQQDILVGRTAVGWTGDAETVWPQPRHPDAVDLHWQTLDLALQSRTTLLRTLVIVTHSAVKIATLLALPGGVLLALPTLWRCINRLMDEYR